MSWKYTDASNESAFRINANGQYESWLVAALPKGTVIEPADPVPVSVPASCTRRQGLRALLDFGIKRADIEAQIAAIENEIEREEAQIDYEAGEWERANPRLQQMWAALGGDPAQLDDLFRLAVTL
ncbi:hypothetical protein IB233_02270 [Comamonas sp. CMM01]|uniref:hypothetical protein n=1 Tax=Comamonas sp. CMM01 TaxID=2769280 RepID=UPI001786E66A|nr:hypothetical protein [Comamonas sp. CMM01]MBD9530458.1 hypothetical protein [Comamonas sp. CMM01]